MKEIDEDREERSLHRDDNIFPSSSGSDEEEDDEGENEGEEGEGGGSRGVAVRARAFCRRHRAMLYSIESPYPSRFLRQSSHRRFCEPFVGE